MKKGLLSLFAIIICLTLVTGCGDKKKETTKEETNKNETNNTVNNTTNNEETKVEDVKMTYYCNKEDEGEEYYFYYKNNVLETVEYVFNIYNDEDYDSAEEVADNYDSVTITQRADGYGVVKVDMKTNGIVYLKDNFDIFSDLEGTSWEDISVILNEKLDCSSKGALEPITGTGNAK